MKKWINLTLCILCSAALAGCGSETDSTARTTNNTKTVNQVLVEGIKSTAEEKQSNGSAENADGTASVITDVSDVQYSLSSEAEQSQYDTPEQSQAGNIELNQNGAPDFSQSSDTELNQESTAYREVGTASTAISGTKGIDVDLTTLSSTMVYSEVYDMVTEPEDFIGKVVKMDGLFQVYHDTDTDKYYFACIIQDATACCAQGIEFTLEGDASYPEDYPEIGEEITVVGVFGTYSEGGYLYCTLNDSVLV